MWQPTHVQVTVQRAKGLVFKGKHETNDAFVVIALGKEKFQTSIKERSSNPVEWHEECDLEIPRQGNTAALQLTVYHRNALGMDEFLGQVACPLSEFDVYERPRTRTYKLMSKPDKAKKKPDKDRGELEAKIAFVVKSGDYLEPGKKEKHKSSMTSLKNIGGSMLSLRAKDKQSLKKFTKSVSSKMDKIVPKKKKSSNSHAEDDFPPSQLLSSNQWSGHADPGVISDEEDELGFDEVKLAGGASTVSSSPYSISSRASERHQHPVIVDDESMTGIDYPPPQAVHHSNSHHDSSSATGNGDALLGTEHSTSASSSIHPSTPSPSFHQKSSDHISKVKTPLVIETAASPESVGADVVKPVTATSVHSNGSPENDGSSSTPPSPDPFSLNINFANMTPVELPALKAKPRQSLNPESVGVESSNANASVHSSFVSTNPFDQPSDIPDNQSSSVVPKPVIDSVNLFEKKASQSINNNPEIDRKDSTESTISPLPSKLIAPTPRRRSSVPSYPLQMNTKSSPPPSNYEIGRSFSQSGGLVASSAKSSGNLVEGSPLSVRSGHSMASSWATGSVTSLGKDEGGIGVRSELMVRGGSVKEKRSSDPVEDEWERKLCGRRSMVGSLERLSGGAGGSSRSSLNNSCASSTHDLQPNIPEYYSVPRQPEVKALTLERSTKLSPSEDLQHSEKKHKRKGFKSRLFSKGTNNRERFEEERRVVEGGNDKLPNAPVTNPHSKLSQEVHNRFAGKSREDLMEQIITLQSMVERQAHHSRDLEEYIDNLLIRVIDASPHLLQAPTTPQTASTRNRFMRL